MRFVYIRLISDAHIKTVKKPNKYKIELNKSSCQKLTTTSVFSNFYKNDLLKSYNPKRYKMYYIYIAKANIHHTT